ncbi:hypothetical protein C8R43DRAFT_965729 [Mycena crocata]|nr:hypothetical protein C8R43DRAFT_965729 [Mycena crocata]
MSRVDESSPPNLDPSPSQHGSGSISLELLDPVYSSNRLSVQLEPNGPLDPRLTQCSENSLVPKVSMKQKKKRRGRHTQSINRSNLISNCSVNTTGIKSTVQLDMDRKHTGKAESRIPGGNTVRPKKPSRWLTSRRTLCRRWVGGEQNRGRGGNKEDHCPNATQQLEQWCFEFFGITKGPQTRGLVTLSLSTTFHHRPGTSGAQDLHNPRVMFDEYSGAALLVDSFDNLNVWSQTVPTLDQSFRLSGKCANSSTGITDLYGAGDRAARAGSIHFRVETRVDRASLSWRLRVAAIARQSVVVFSGSLQHFQRQLIRSRVPAIQNGSYTLFECLA